jgi:hypothetical protein
VKTMIAAANQALQREAELSNEAYSSPTATSPLWPTPIEEPAYHGIVGDIVREISPHSEADPAALLITVLVWAGNEIGRGPYSMAERDRHGLNLNAVIVGNTSKGRKGVSEGHIRELFERIDPTWVKNRVVSGLSSGEGLIWAIRDPIHSSNGEIVDEGVTDKRLMVVESEFVSPLKAIRREGNTLSAVIRLGWDGKQLSTLTKTSAAKASEPHVSILGHTSVEELVKYLHETEMFNGFANRFLWCCVRRSKILPEGGGDINYRLIVPAMKQVIDNARQIGQMQRDDEAREMWKAIYPDLSEGKPGLLGAVTNRAEAQVLRLSSLYAALDGTEVIRPSHLAAALAVWDYCEASARYIFGNNLGDSVADKIYLAAKSKNGRLTRTEMRDLFDRNLSSNRIDLSLRQLADAGLMNQSTETSGGRPVEVWKINQRYDINDQNDKRSIK